MYLPLIDEPMAIYLFNPENDLALANFTPYYRPPAEIVRMADDLAVLPAWYALPGSVVKLGREVPVPRWDMLAGGEVPVPCVGWTAEWMSAACSPWGWNPALVRMLRLAGVDDACLPSPEEMECIRELSGRVAGMQVLRRLVGDDRLCGEAYACRSLEEVGVRTAGWRRYVLKAPWSGSGKGIVFVGEGGWTASVEGWAARVLRTQGTVMVEPLYDKVCDFAMEFRACDDGRVSFAGYSLFCTGASGRYKTNLLASDAWMERKIAEYVPPSLLRDVSCRLLEVLPSWIGRHYRGYLGVDMMVVRCGGGFAVHPCVEVNLRMNMGVLSRLFFDRYVHPSVRGRLSVVHYPVMGDALRFHTRMCREHPVRLAEGRLAGGYLSLTPVGETTRYQVYVRLGGHR